MYTYSSKQPSSGYVSLGSSFCSAASAKQAPPLGEVAAQITLLQTSVALRRKSITFKRMNLTKIAASSEQFNILTKQPDNKQEVVSITYEEIGLFPRSFSRVLDRFLKQVFSDVENLVIEEYRFYRYLFLTTLKCLLVLFFIPFFVNFIAKTYVVKPLTEYWWNTKQTEIFLNHSQQKRAFAELKEFEEKTYFESLILPKSVFIHDHITWVASPALNNHNMNGIMNSSPADNIPSSRSQDENQKKSENNLQNQAADLHDFNNTDLVTDWQTSSSKLVDNLKHQHRQEEKMQLIAEEVKSQNELKQNSLPNLNWSLFMYETQEAHKNIQQRYQEKTIELAQRYNDQSIEAITNIFADLITVLTLVYLLYALEIQINITKSFLLEVFFGLDDSKKSLLILLVTDLLVGYHSSNLWELFFEFLFHHYGLPESQTGVFLLVATLPVLLDVLFKYLIFRHLNRSSPATVATYHAMIE